jgi:hypothetical protein
MGLPPERSYTLEPAEKQHRTAQLSPEVCFTGRLLLEVDVFTFLLWLFLLIICWPLALLAILLYPVFWVLLLPFRLVGIAVGGVFNLLTSIFNLPARLLRGPRSYRNA